MRVDWAEFLSRVRRFRPSLFCSQFKFDMPLRHTRQAPSNRAPISPVHRGPQANNTITGSSSVSLHAPNAALLIDFDNVTMGIRSDLAAELKSLLSSDIVKGKVSVQRAYADWRRYPQYIVPLSESSIDLIFAPAYGSSKKNATDIRLAIDALELVFTRPEIGTFILLSGDSDFSSLVIKLKEYGKYVIGVGIRESSSDLLVQNCDEYYSYNALAGLVNTRDEEIIKWDPWELASEAIQRMKRNGDVMRADRLKQVMQQIDSSFDEKNLGMSKFSRFILEGSHRGILSLRKMENGQYEVDLPKLAPGEVPLKESAPAPLPPAPEKGASEAPSSEEKRGRGRLRRGRRSKVSTPDIEESADASAAENEEVVLEEKAAPVEKEPVVESADTSSADTAIGKSGIRLTRTDAFDLVKRAVAVVSPQGKPVSASVVRTEARKLLERDSESLSERNFIRILQDAHDADIVDLRRRGNDYEVAPSTEVAPISDQLSIAAVESAKESPSSSSPSVTPHLPRGMGPRGAPGRGPRSAGTPVPADLLSIGVVNLANVKPASANSTAKDAVVEEEKVETPTPEKTTTAAPSSGTGTRKTARKTKTAARKAASTTSAGAAKSAGRKTAAKTRAKTAAKSTARKAAAATPATGRKSTAKKAAQKKSAD